MIELCGVSYEHRLRGKNKRVLANVDLYLEAGQTLGILGGPGSGKTTLMRIMSKAIPPSQGRVLHGGRVSWPVGNQAVFDKNLSPEENCRFIARLYGAHEGEVVDRTRAYADIARRFFLPMKHCTKEQRSKIAFAACMAIDFDVYLIDGSPPGEDKAFQDKCFEVLLSRKTQSTLVVTARKPGPLRRLTDSYALLRRRKLSRFESLEDAVRKSEAA